MERTSVLTEVEPNAPSDWFDNEPSLPEDNISRTTVEIITADQLELQENSMEGSFNTSRTYLTGKFLLADREPIDSLSSSFSTMEK